MLRELYLKRIIFINKEWKDVVQMKCYYSWWIVKDEYNTSCLRHKLNYKIICQIRLTHKCVNIEQHTIGNAKTPLVIYTDSYVKYVDK